MSQSPASSPRPAAWAVLLALTLVYLAWGTTFIAIKEGVKEFPPALFGGTRILTAGLLLLGFLKLRGQSLRLPLRDLLALAAVALFMFLGGNWLISMAQKTVPSSETSILVATTPLWMALLELVWPWGDRLRWQGWLGLALGLVGVGLLMPSAHGLADFFSEPGRFLVLGSAFSWVVGSFLLRHRRRSHVPRLLAAAYQMVLGGLAMSLLGTGLGEWQQITPDKFTPAAVYAYFHLLVFGSLVGYLAYLWLLDHVPAALAGSYAYVNPVIAVFLGWWLEKEELTWHMLFGMAVILASVFLVRSGVVHPAPASPDAELGDAPVTLRPAPARDCGVEKK